jgi:hypothetical protein
MSDYELSLTASEIDAALGKAHNPDTTLTGTLNSDPSLATAGAIKTYVDNSATPTETLSDGITNTDNAVPTSAAVKDFVEGSISSSIQTGAPTFLARNVVLADSRYIQLVDYRWLYTAPSSGIVMVFGGGGHSNSSYNQRRFVYGSHDYLAETNIANGIYRITWFMGVSGTPPAIFPVGKGDLYTVYAPHGTVLFKSFQT